MTLNQEDGSITNSHTKNCSKLLAMGEMQIKTTVLLSYIVFDWLKLKRLAMVIIVKGAEIPELLCTAVGNLNWCTTILENGLTISQ